MVNNNHANNNKSSYMYVGYEKTLVTPRGSMKNDTVEHLHGLQNKRRTKGYQPLVLKNETNAEVP